MSHVHAVVWLDSRQAHVFQFNADDVEREAIKAHTPFRKVHHKAGVIGSGHPHEDKAYFESIVEALSGATEWLIAGPGGAKNEFATYLGKNPGQAKGQVMGVVPMDHPTDGELVANARKFFKAADKIAPTAD